MMARTTAGDVGKYPLRQLTLSPMRVHRLILGKRTDHGLAAPPARVESTASIMLWTASSWGCARLLPVASMLSSRWMVTTVDAPVLGPVAVSSLATLAPPSGGVQPQVDTTAPSGQVPPTFGKQPAMPPSEAAVAAPATPVRISRRVIPRL